MTSKSWSLIGISQCHPGPRSSLLQAQAKQAAIPLRTLRPSLQSAERGWLRSMSSRQRQKMVKLSQRRTSTNLISMVRSTLNSSLLSSAFGSTKAIAESLRRRRSFAQKRRQRLPRWCSVRTELPHRLGKKVSRVSSQPLSKPQTKKRLSGQLLGSAEKMRRLFRRSL